MATTMFGSVRRRRRRTSKADVVEDADAVGTVDVDEDADVAGEALGPGTGSSAAKATPTVALTVARKAIGRRTAISKEEVRTGRRTE